MVQQHIFVVDDEPNVRQVITSTLEQSHIGVVSCFENAMDCLENLQSQRCDLLITDLKMPDMDGIELLTSVKHLMPWMPILIVTGYGDVPTAVKAIKAGAADFIEKPLTKESFLRKVKSLLPENGNHKHLGGSLTETEKRVLKLVLDGKSNKEIADVLNRSQRTIEVHRNHVMQKLGANSLVDLVKRSMQMGLFELPA